MSTEIADLSDLDPQAATVAWPIVAVGRRPRDFMGRDLIIGSCQRDLRLRRFRRHFNGLPDWATEMTHSVPRDRRQQATQLLVFQYEHRCHLAKLMEQAEDLDLRRLQRIWRCPPYGMQHEWAGEQNSDVFRTCDLQRQCPWCQARMAMQLHDRIESGAWQDPSDRLLVQATLRFDDQDLNEAGFARESRIRTVRRNTASQFLKFADSIGIDGGLLTYLIGPRRFAENEWDGGEVTGPRYWRGYDYFLSVLGEVGERRHLLRQHVAEASESTHELAGVSIGSKTFWPDVRVRSGHRALRQLLIGTSLRRPSNNELGDGRGALFVPSWPLADFDQWQTHAEQTRGLPIFTFFGSWRQARRQHVR